ncbi:hypothetical protein BDQ17DRAFT_1441327 [Cyathus striatus]|nr:hypothetical protein BDQ17DRAFT_1441327 [Cyathus striatus]
MLTIASFVYLGCWHNIHYNEIREYIALNSVLSFHNSKTGLPAEAKGHAFVTFYPEPDYKCELWEYLLPNKDEAQWEAVSHYYQHQDPHDPYNDASFHPSLIPSHLDPFCVPLLPDFPDERSHSGNLQLDDTLTNTDGTFDSFIKLLKHFDHNKVLPILNRIAPHNVQYVTGSKFKLLQQIGDFVLDKLEKWKGGIPLSQELIWRKLQDNRDSKHVTKYPDVNHVISWALHAWPKKMHALDRPFISHSQAGLLHLQQYTREDTCMDSTSSPPCSPISKLSYLSDIDNMSDVSSCTSASPLLPEFESNPYIVLPQTPLQSPIISAQELPEPITIKKPLKYFLLYAASNIDISSNEDDMSVTAELVHVNKDFGESISGCDDNDIACAFDDPMVDDADIRSEPMISKLLPTPSPSVPLIMLTMPPLTTCVVSQEELSTPVLAPLPVPAIPVVPISTPPPWLYSYPPPICTFTPPPSRLPSPCYMIVYAVCDPQMPSVKVYSYANTPSQTTSSTYDSTLPIISDSPMPAALSSLFTMSQPATPMTSMMTGDSSALLLSTHRTLVEAVAQVMTAPLPPLAAAAQEYYLGGESPAAPIQLSWNSHVYIPQLPPQYTLRSVSPFTSTLPAFLPVHAPATPYVSKKVSPSGFIPSSVLSALSARTTAVPSEPIPYTHTRSPTPDLLPDLISVSNSSTNESAPKPAQRPFPHTIMKLFPTLFSECEQDSIAKVLESCMKDYSSEAAKVSSSSAN